MKYEYICLSYFFYKYASGLTNLSCILWANFFLVKKKNTKISSFWWPFHIVSMALYMWGSRILFVCSQSSQFAADLWFCYSSKNQSFSWPNLIAVESASIFGHAKWRTTRGSQDKQLVGPKPRFRPVIICTCFEKKKKQ